MAGFFENLLKDAAGAFFGSDYLRDYTHASKTFRTNAYEYAPKFKYLFHTYFDINAAAYPVGLSTGANFGLAVKTVKLPSFNFDLHQMNQYNRKRIVQTKIKYDDVGITFHDTNLNHIRNLWKAYYYYYYNDGTKPKVVFAGSRGGAPAPTTSGGGTTASATAADYNKRTTYLPSITGDDNWGYVGEPLQSQGSASGEKIPFFKNITVFGFNQHNFVAYTLINPVIKNMSHDTYDYAQGTGTMEMSMSFDYETVVYNEGAIDGRAPSNIVAGFGLEDHYDRTTSPIAKAGANGTILGQGGLVDAAGGAIEDLTQGNILGAIQKAGTAYNTFKNKDITQVVKNEILVGATNAIRNTPNNRNTLFNIPGPFGASPGPSGLAGSPTIARSSPQLIGSNPYVGTSDSFETTQGGD